ncbi:MAG: hypothetical protein OEX19_13500 [Gammaproteobacteria bacterium]|nr:hypothetical protein [Gammaproteobacteria bacterium]
MLRIRVVFAILFVNMLQTERIYANQSLMGMQTHGFLTQSYIKTDRNNFFGESAGRGSIDFRELGVNASIRPFSKLTAGAQILYRDAGASEDQKLLLDFALLDYRLLYAGGFSSGLRAGRIKNPMGLYNDTRDVAFTRPGIILPQSIYFDRARDLALSYDGLQSYSYFTTDSYEIQMQLALGYTRLSTSSEISLFSRNMPGELKSLPSYLAKLSIQLFDNHLKLSYSDIGMFVDYLSTPAEGLVQPSLEFRPKIFSLEFNLESLVLTGEYALREFTFTNFSEIPGKSIKTGESYYMQLAYFVTPKIKITGRYDVTYLDRTDRTGVTYEESTQGLVPAFTRYSKDYTLGVQWFINRSWLVMLEQHKVSGTSWLPVQDNPDSSLIKKDWWMFSALVSYRF